MSKKNPNHIDCGTANEWLHLLLDGELQPAAHARLMDHLQSCSRCSAAHRELSALEAAHAALSRGSTEAPPGYFDTLSAKVMARIANAEAKPPRLLALRRPAPLLWWRQLTHGPGKYVVAAAAVALLAVVLTRELRQDGSKGAAPVATPSLSLPPDATVARSGEPGPAEPASEAAMPERKKRIQPPAARETVSDQEQAAQEADELIAGQEMGEAENDLAAVPPAAPALLIVASEESQGPPGAKGELSQLSKAGAALTQEQKLLPEQESGETAARVKSTAPVPAGAAPLETRADFATLRTGGNRFTDAMRRAELAGSELEKQKIWREFVKTTADSAYRALAFELLGQSLAAGTDSSSTVAQMEEATRFFREQEAILRPLMGTDVYERHRARLEGLLSWKRHKQGR